MITLIPAVLVAFAACVGAQTLSYPQTLEGGFAQAGTAAASVPVRTSAAVAKCWRRAVDERISFTGMPLTVCVDRVEFELPRNSAGDIYLEGAGIVVDPGMTRSARVTAFGRAAHPGSSKESGAKPFSLSLAGETSAFGRKTAAGYRVWAHVFVTDTRIGEDALVILNMNLDRNGSVVPGSAVLEAFTTCPEERCYGRYDETKVEFAEILPAELAVSEKLMSCWERPRGARTAADEVNMTRMVCVNTVELVLRSNREGDLLANGAGMTLFPEDRKISTASGFGQLAWSYINGPRTFRIDAQPLSARRTAGGYRAEVVLEASHASEDGRAYSTMLDLELSRDGRVTGSAVRGVVSCVDDRACGGLTGDLMTVDFIRDPK